LSQGFIASKTVFLLETTKKIVTVFFKISVKILYIFSPEAQVEKEPEPTIDKENEMLPPADTNVPRRGSIPSREDTPKNKNLGKI
jgi:hypothetical protein